MIPHWFWWMLNLAAIAEQREIECDCPTFDIGIHRDSVLNTTNEIVVYMDCRCGAHEWVSEPIDQRALMGVSG